MRLTDEQRNAIVEEAVGVFGPGARVRLFGSRVDDKIRGGDIDLHVETEGSAAELLDRELKFYARLIRRLGERRIDIVVHRRGEVARPIDERAWQTGVVL
ncbi:MAG: nucleotidyltransferase domain-containing protein [Porticoccaceae bacterium]